MQPPSKQALRKRYRERRINLSDEEFRLLNGQLMERVRQLDMTRYATAHLFLPIEGNREPDTYAIAEWLRQAYPRMRLVLSRTDVTAHRMLHFTWDDETVLERNPWGVPEPKSGVVVSAHEIDVVFVPLLAFDENGNRVGYGKGFYDRFLSECRATTLKIGLSLFEAEPVITGIGAHDIALDTCITPTRIWNFNTAP